MVIMKSTMIANKMIEDDNAKKLLEYNRYEMIQKALYDAKVFDKIKLNIEQSQIDTKKISVKFWVLDEEELIEIEKRLLTLYKGAKNPIERKLLKEIEDILAKDLKIKAIK